MGISEIVKIQASEQFNQKRNKVIENVARKSITLDKNNASFKEILALYIK
jgi:hypothetical protein